jgi:hypothetical protein
VCSNADEKPNDIAVIGKMHKSMTDDEKLDKLQSIWVPDINYNFPTASSCREFKR